MKTILLIVITLLSSFGQQHNFEVLENELIWQKVYEEELTIDDFEKSILGKGPITSIDKTENTLFVRFEGLKLDYKALGKSEMWTSMYITRSNISGLATIQFKENKYRITIADIVLTQNYSDGLMQQGEKHPLSFYAIKNGSLRKAFLKKDAEIFDFNFIGLFAPSKVKDDW